MHIVLFNLKPQYYLFYLPTVFCLIRSHSVSKIQLLLFFFIPKIKS